MSNLLVTGGAGFIGCNFVYYWQETYPEDQVVILDALTYAGHRDSLARAEQHPNCTFVQGNILNLYLVESLMQTYEIDTIVHFAAESHVDRSITGPDTFIQTNVVGTHTLLKAAKGFWLTGQDKPHRFHHISTDEVYGTLGPDDPPFTETTPYAPNSPYAASKAASDHLVRAYHETYGLQVTTSNCSNNYGPFQFPEKLMPLIITRILDNRPLPVYGDGQQIRDWLFVDDHNRGVDLILKNGVPGRTYNIGGSNEQVNLDVVRTICRLMDAKFDADPALKKRFPQSPAANGSASAGLITHVRDRAGHDRRYAVDARTITRELGYLPVFDFESGLDRTIDWYLANESWWRALLDRTV